MKIDLRKIDINKIDLSKIEITNWIAAGFLLIVFLDLFIFSSLIQGIWQAQAKMVKETAAMNFFKSEVSQKDRLTKARVIPYEGIDALLDKIQKIAEKNNIDVKMGVSLDTDKQDDDNRLYVRKVFSMNASGLFKDFGIFLMAMRDLPDGIIDIGSLHITGDGSNASNIQAQINAVVFTTQDNE